MHTAPSIIYVSSGNSHALSLYELGLRRFQSFETIYDRDDALAMRNVLNKNMANTCDPPFTIRHIYTHYILYIFIWNSLVPTTAHNFYREFFIRISTIQWLATDEKRAYIFVRPF